MHTSTALGNFSSHMLLHDPESPPANLYYPTSTQLLGAVLANGLRSHPNHMLHLFEDAEIANALAPALAERVIVTVQASSMAEQGFTFRRTENGVWLTGSVPPEFLL